MIRSTSKALVCDNESLSPQVVQHILKLEAQLAATEKERNEFQDQCISLKLQLAELKKAEPVAWCLVYDDPRMGRIHSTPSMYEPEIDLHVSRCEGRVTKAPLYAAPVAQQKAEPVAWRVFDGEGGYDLIGYADNEDYRDKFIERNPSPMYATWVEPLYAAPVVQDGMVKDAELNRGYAKDRI